MRQVHGGGVALALGLMPAAVGCSSNAETCTTSACKQGEGARPTNFETDLADPSGSTPGDDSGTAAPTSGTSTPASATDATRAAAERAISEADVIQVQGDRLYALSRVSGLAIIDVSQPSALKLLGRYRDLPATPFELDLRGDVALVMFSGWGQYLSGR